MKHLCDVRNSCECSNSSRPHFFADDEVNPKCLAELNDARRSLMEDYQINPELVNGCAQEISKHCNGLEAGGKTMHCLMELAQHHFKEVHEGQEKRMSEKCQRQVGRWNRQGGGRGEDIRGKGKKRERTRMAWARRESVHAHAILALSFVHIHICQKPKE